MGDRDLVLERLRRSDGRCERRSLSATFRALLASLCSLFSSLSPLFSSFSAAFLLDSSSSSAGSLGAEPLKGAAERLAGAKPLVGTNTEVEITANDLGGLVSSIAYNATAKASSSASLIFRISSLLSASVSFASRAYQCTSLFFCQRPVGALMEWPKKFQHGPSGNP